MAPRPPACRLLCARPPVCGGGRPGGRPAEPALGRGSRSSQRDHLNPIETRPRTVILPRSLWLGNKYQSLTPATAQHLPSFC